MQSPPDALPILRWPATYLGEVTTPAELVQRLVAAQVDAADAAEYGLTLDTRYVVREEARDDS